MVLLQDIPFELRSLANQKRNLETQLLTVQQAARRGQFKGKTPDPCQQRFRAGSQDCAAFKSVQNLPTGGELKASIEAIQLQMDDLLQAQIQEVEPIIDISITEGVIEIQPQNNTLRNALIIGGVLLLVL